MAHRKTLNQRQFDVLQWIKDGCPPDRFAGEAEQISVRISAAALRTRGLVRVEGKGRAWEAQITKEGVRVLEEAGRPDAPSPRQGNVSKTQQFVDELVASGGTIAVEADYTARQLYERRARDAATFRRLPPGQRIRLETSGQYGRVLTVSLIPDDFADRDPSEPVKLTVPDAIPRLHPTARAFRDRRWRHEVSAEQLARAVRIIHVLAVEAERRGCKARTPDGPDAMYGTSRWTPGASGHLSIDANGVEYRVRLHEEGVHFRGPWEEEVKSNRGRTTDWRGNPVPSGPYDADATGRLELVLARGESWSAQQSRIGDRSSWSLEDRLGHVFFEIERRTVEDARAAQDRELAAERAAEARRVAEIIRREQWDQAMAAARVLLLETQRRTELQRQIAALREVDQIRAYCDAVENRHTGAESIAWAREYADSIDPLSSAPSMPPRQEETDEALQAHLLPGWSARGPQFGRTRDGYDVAV